ncbi:MAG: hypothetical protein ABI891_10390 [Acidobacteriota bacterium]
MRDKCFEIGIIQAFLDGELASNVSENVARHVALCDDCAILLAEAEDETAFAFSALESELNTLVPTQRLWSKINDSIEKKERTFWEKLYAFVSNPTSIAFASILVVFGVFIGILNLQSNEPEKSVAQNVQNKQIPVLPVSKSETNIAQNSQDADLSEIKITESNPEKRDYKVVKTKFEKAKESPKINKQSNSNIKTPEVKTNYEPRMASENLSGEDSYLKTIAALTKTVDNRKDETLKPSARFAFEKDLAVIDDAIGKMQTEVKKNPKNETAKEMLRASYQNKIDLLNSVSEKSELMASLR